MLEFCKTVLRKVSFDRSLFRKELKKARSRLKRPEKESLKEWCLRTFGPNYRRDVMDIFDGGAV